MNNDRFITLRESDSPQIILLHGGDYWYVKPVTIECSTPYVQFFFLNQAYINQPKAFFKQKRHKT